jgi:hypothetical protein
MEIQVPPNLDPSKYFSTFLLLCCWHSGTYGRGETTKFSGPSKHPSQKLDLTACKTEVETTLPQHGAGILLTSISQKKKVSTVCLDLKIIL